MAQRMKGKTIKTAPVKPVAPAPASDSESPGHDVDVSVVRALAEVVSREGLSELRIKTKSAIIILRRGAAPVVPAAPASLHTVTHLTPPAPAFHGQPAHTLAAHPVPPPHAAAPSSPPANVTVPTPAEDGRFVYVTSPFVGTFYRSPSPEAPQFVEVGQEVHKGQVLCIVEAMKLMNEIEAESDGTVVAVLVENAQPVEYGQQLFKIAP
jgi:acetyl-CoA carboxylase biotin carboxyl carrier protein